MPFFSNTTYQSYGFILVTQRHESTVTLLYSTKDTAIQTKHNYRYTTIETKTMYQSTKKKKKKDKKGLACIIGFALDKSTSLLS